MNKFKANDIVRRREDYEKYGVGIVIEDSSLSESMKQIITPVLWRMPAWNIPEGVDRQELYDDLIPISFEDITDDEDREWVLTHLRHKPVKKTIVHASSKDMYETEKLNNPETFRKNMKKLDRQIRQVKKTRMKWVNAELALFRILFKKMDCIEVPSNDEEVEAMRFYIQKYDESIEKIEKEFISKFRRYVEEN